MLISANNFWPALQTLKGVSEGCMTRYAIQRYEPLKAELQAFVRAIQQDTPVPVTGDDGLAALKPRIVYGRIGSNAPSN